MTNILYIIDLQKFTYFNCRTAVFHFVQDCRFSLCSKRLPKWRAYPNPLHTGLPFFALFRTAVFRFAQNVFLNGGRTQTLSTFSLCEYVGFFNAHLLIQASLIRISH
jgi:hypothetical protein